MNSRDKIRFFFKSPVSLKDRTKLKSFIFTLFSKEGKHLGQLNYIFCRDKDLLKINREYLKHDFYTDILTFDLSETKRSVTGEVYISVDRVRENSRKYQTTIGQELKRVIFHGALHLCGYNDKTAKGIKEMRQMEEFYLQEYSKRST